MTEKSSNPLSSPMTPGNSSPFPPLSSVVQEKWSIATYLRIKPFDGEASEQIMYEIQDIVAEDGTKRSIIELDIPIDADPGILHNNSASGTLRYEFDQIFGASIKQEDLFEVVAKEKVLDVLEGLNCTIFAYGQTGSGKTYTIFGGETYQERGIIPRTLSTLFTELKQRRKKMKSFSYKCQISFTEIYKETVYDLLDQEKRAGNALESFPVVQIFEAEEGIVLRNLSVYQVTSEEEALQLFFMGNSNRITSSTAMNNASSRSHAVFTIVLETEGIKEDRTVFTAGKINLVDLAGSERMYKLTNTKDAIKEAKSINLSLHFLEQVIICLREQAQQSKTTTAKNPFIPYRNSVLTNMLRDSLGGNCKSSFLLNISTEKLHFEETVATCRFGQRCGEVKVKISANTEIGLSDQLKELQSRVKSLEKRLQSSEAHRKQLEASLEQEQEQLRIQTELRQITPQEKQSCKTCVQELLAAAKESLAATTNNPTSKEAKDTADAIIAKSQDLLYEKVEEMDKAVLVELSTALGGLVQSMYIEREIVKQEEATKEFMRKQSEEEKRELQQAEQRQLDAIKRGDYDVVSSFTSLPTSILAALNRGAVFIKHSRMGQKTPRFIQISKDLRTLLWTPLITGKEATISVLLKDYEGLEVKDVHGNSYDWNSRSNQDIGIITLKGKAGVKSMMIEYITTSLSANNNNHTDSMILLTAKEWSTLLKYLIAKNNK